MRVSVIVIFGIVDDVRRCKRMIVIWSKIGVVPVGMRKIKVDFDSFFMCRLAKFFHNVAFEGCIFDTVSDVARFDDFVRRVQEVCALFDPRFCMPERKTVVMFASQCKSLHSATLKPVRPFFRVERCRIECLIEILIFLFLFGAHLKQWP